MRRIERALLTWGDAQEEPEGQLKIAKLWTALEALLRREPEPVWKTVSRRSVALAMMKLGNRLTCSVSRREMENVGKWS